uniref:Si:ch211-76l23.4 n=1 Tax=Cyprinus carpio TaxID=7962 RepID=A0A8C1T857_CYPCA
MSFRVSLLFLTMTVVVVCGQKRRPAKEEWNYRDGSERVSMRGVANLTQVLDDWRFDILSQVKGLLQNDHQSLLPDYSRYTIMRFNQTLRFSHSFFPQEHNVVILASEAVSKCGLHSFQSRTVNYAGNCAKYFMCLMRKFLAPYGLDCSHLHIPQSSLPTSDCAIPCCSHISFSL